MRKLLLVGATILFARDPSYQVYTGLWVLMLLLLRVVQAIQRSEEGFLETLSLGATLLSLLLGQALALGGLSTNAEHAIRALAATVNVLMLALLLVAQCTEVRAKPAEQTAEP